MAGTRLYRRVQSLTFGLVVTARSHPPLFPHSIPPIVRLWVHRKHQTNTHHPYSGANGHLVTANARNGANLEISSSNELFRNPSHFDHMDQFLTVQNHMVLVRRASLLSLIDGFEHKEVVFQPWKRGLKYLGNI